MITCITCRTPDEYADYIAYRYYKIVGSRVRTMTHNCNYDAVIDALKRKGFLHERSFKLRQPIDVFFFMRRIGTVWQDIRSSEA